MVWTGVEFNQPSSPGDLLYVDIEQRRQLHDELLAEKPNAARHDTDICAFCVDKASQSTASDPSGSGRPGVPTEDTSTEGGTRTPMTDTANITQEAHDALVRKAVEEATKTVEAALQTKTTELAEATTKITGFETEVADLRKETDRLNTELDSAQVKLTAATDEVSSLKEDIAKKETEAAMAEVASKRVEQVKNLKLFEDEFITTERSSRWAGMEEAAWTEQLEEWKQLKPASTATGDGKTDDTASAMSGTSDLTKDADKKDDDSDTAAGDKKSARRAVLAL